MTPQSGKLTWNEVDIKTPAQQRQLLWNFVDKYTGDPRVIDFASWLIRKYKVAGRDETGLARAIQVYSQDYVKYFREKPERFASPMRTVKWGIGDCDDKSILIASVLRSFRIPVKLKFLKYEAPQKDGTIKKISHVYPLAKLDGKWVALESVHKWALGDDPEIRALAKKLRPVVFLIGDN